VKQILDIHAGVQCEFSMQNLAIDTAIGAATGFLPPLKVGGLNAGRGSPNAIFKQMTTKLKNGTISHVSLSTAIKMAEGRFWDTAVPAGIVASVDASWAASYWGLYEQ
jgi:type VI secretion system secreted protein VgrG